MNNFFKIGLLALIFSAQQACESTDKSRISGVIEGADVVYISEIRVDKQQPLDTLELQDGKLNYEFEIDSAGFYHISTAKGSAIAVYINPGEEVEVNATVTENNMQYEVEGNDESQRIRKVYGILQKAAMRRDSLDKVAQMYQDSANFKEISMHLNQRFQVIITEAQSEAKALIDSDPGNITNIFIFPLSVGQVPLIPAEENFSYFEDAAAAIAERNPHSPHAQAFVERVAKYKEALQQKEAMEQIQKNIAPGAVAPDIALPASNGEIRKLSDLRGKVVLVDFWASWCQPCRIANPNLVKTYQKYKDQGFEIFSVSLDGDPRQPNAKQDWLGAIQQDNLIWENHVSDLKGWDSEAIKKYGIQSIPFTVLVDRDGTIITTQLHGPMLEEQLKKTLGKS